MRPKRRRGHHVFARLFSLLSHREESYLSEYRCELLAGLSGRVVEIGAGNGLSFRFYPLTVREVIAIEPEPYLRAQVEHGARQASVPIHLLDAVAEELPFPTCSVDAVVCSLALCSVVEPLSALTEIRRVIKVG